jgi:hypothetical protein
MAKQIIHRTAGDNQYLHPDFHGALSVGIEYLHENYGEEAVRRYLWQFSRTFYAPLTSDLIDRGLVALDEHFRNVYQREGAVADFALSKEVLEIRVDACPAVTHMRKRKYPVARLFRETTDTVNRAICHQTPFAAELVCYDDETGRSVQRFYRRES